MQTLNTLKPLADYPNLTWEEVSAEQGKLNRVQVPNRQEYEWRLTMLNLLYRKWAAVIGIQTYQRTIQDCNSGIDLLMRQQVSRR